MFGFFDSKDEAPRTPLELFNTATGTLEKFVPQKKGIVTMYSCGPTVYDYAHIGNLRSYVFADTLKRTLIYNNYAVRHTINLTDFGHLVSDADEGEDKMMLALKRAGKPVTISAMRAVAEPFIDAFKEDLAALRIEPPTTYTRASDYVKEQIALIKTLVDKGYTYETTDGIYFNIAAFPQYGTLGNIDIEALQAGARVASNPEKRHPADFALWKKGLLGWESPWSKGFPGWHIECSAMAMATLGKQLDIHTGGIDHIATHHNAEIAQSEAATNKQPFVHYWLHNAFINLDEQKIAKSLGNVIGLRQLADRGYKAEVYRYWLLTGHYRSPMNVTFEALDGSKQALQRLKRHMLDDQKSGTNGVVLDSYRDRFLTAINDDLNTPQAIALLWELVKDTDVSPADRTATIRDFDTVLALGLDKPIDEVRRELGVLEADDIPATVHTLVAEREDARKTKDWDAADRIRKEINLKGYTIEDSASGPKITKSPDT